MGKKQEFTEKQKNDFLNFIRLKISKKDQKYLDNLIETVFGDNVDYFESYSNEYGNLFTEWKRNNKINQILN